VNAFFVAVGCVFLVMVARAQQLPLGTFVGGPAAASTNEGSVRDPFVSLLTAKKDASVPKPGTILGLRDVSVSAVSVKGIVRSGSSLIAVLEVPGRRSFIARVKDGLQDGVVKAIDSEGVTIATTLVDAAGSRHSPDVRKPLRPASEASR